MPSNFAETMMASNLSPQPSLVSTTETCSGCKSQPSSFACSDSALLVDASDIAS